MINPFPGDVARKPKPIEHLFYMHGKASGAYITATPVIDWTS